MNATDKAILYHEMGKLTGADFHLDRAVQLLLDQNPPASRRVWLAGVGEGLGAGKGITESVRNGEGVAASGLEIALISAGEQSGRLHQAFEHLGQYYESMAEGVSKAKGALIYPLILAHLAILVPAVPALVLGTGGNGIWDVLVPVAGLWALIGLLVSLWKNLAARATTSATIDGWLNMIPLAGAARRHWALARFSQVFHSALLAAIRMQECLRLAGESSGSGVMQAASSRAELQVADGGRLGVALRSSGGFPKLFADSISTAEESGTLDRELERWAKAETQMARGATERAATWLPKIAYGMAVLYIVWRIVSMMSGYYAGILSIGEN